MASWKSALTVDTCSRAAAYRREEMRRNTSVATATSGSATSATPASEAFVTTSRPETPKRVNRAMMPWATPVCRKEERASMSVVMRVMIRPDRWRSK